MTNGQEKELNRIAQTQSQEHNINEPVKTVGAVPLPQYETFKGENPIVGSADSLDKLDAE